MADSLTYGSTFSGIGGFDLGFDQAGFEPLWQVENDQDCNRILRKHWEGTKKYHDIRKFQAWGNPDVIFGGFPCQDLSVAGRRAGLAGARSGLFSEFARIVGECTPRFFVVENVPGLFSSRGGRDFITVIRRLSELGYCIAWTVLDSQYFGVAQRRRRVFIVGSLGNGSAAQILFEPESVRGDSPPSREKRQSLATELVGCLEARSSGKFQSGQSAARGHLLPDVAWALQERDAKGCDSDTKDGHLIAFGHVDSDPRGGGDLSPTLRSTNANEGVHKNTSSHVAVAFVENQRAEVRESDISPQLSTQGGKPGMGYPAIAIKLDNQKSNGWGVDEEGLSYTLGGSQTGVTQAVSFQPRIGRNGRGQPQEISPSLSGADAGATSDMRPCVAQSMQVRRLTPRECERLQGFPDDWTRFDDKGKELSDSARYRMLGNAVTVPVARWIAERIKCFGT